MPSATRMPLMMNSAPPTFMPGHRVAMMMDMPLVPPMAKWLGVLNRWMPAAVRKSPRFNKNTYFANSPGLPMCSSRKGISCRPLPALCGFSTPHRSFFTFGAQLCFAQKNPLPANRPPKNGRRRAGSVRFSPAPGHCCRRRRTVILLRAVTPCPALLPIKYAHGHSLFYITTAPCSCQCLQLTLAHLTDFWVTGGKIPARIVWLKLARPAAFYHNFKQKSQRLVSSAFLRRHGCFLPGIPRPEE